MIVIIIVMIVIIIFIIFIYRNFFFRTRFTTTLSSFLFILFIPDLPTPDLDLDPEDPDDLLPVVISIFESIYCCLLLVALADNTEYLKSNSKLFNLYFCKYKLNVNLILKI